MQRPTLDVSISLRGRGRRTENQAVNRHISTHAGDEWAPIRQLGSCERSSIQHLDTPHCCPISRTSFSLPPKPATFSSESYRVVMRSLY